MLALESTIFTHGLPRPTNLDVALEAEERVRALGVTPATIGVLDGVPTVGLSPDEIERLSNVGRRGEGEPARPRRSPRSRA